MAGERSVEFHFYSCGTIPPPVVMVQDVSFRYSESTPYIYKNLEFGIDLDTRLALVGPNGAGKSTLLKLIYGEVRFIAGATDIRSFWHIMSSLGWSLPSLSATLFITCL